MSGSHNKVWDHGNVAKITHHEREKTGRTLTSQCSPGDEGSGLSRRLLKCNAFDFYTFKMSVIGFLYQRAT